MSRLIVEPRIWCEECDCDFAPALLPPERHGHIVWRDTLRTIPFFSAQTGAKLLRLLSRALRDYERRMIIRQIEDLGLPPVAAPFDLVVAERFPLMLPTASFLELRFQYLRG